MIATRIGRRGQITLPKEVRRHTQLREGDRIAFIVEGGRVIIQPLTQTLRELRGSVQVIGPQDFDAVRQQVLTGRAARAAGKDTTAHES